MTNSTGASVHRLILRPTERQAQVLRAHAEYAAYARRWAREHPDTSPKRAYQAFKASDGFDATLSGTVAERAIAGVIDKVVPTGGRLYNAADSQRHGSKHVKVEDVAATRRKPAHRRLRLPKAGSVEIAGEGFLPQDHAVREAWIGHGPDADTWWVEFVSSARMLVRTCKVRMRATPGQRAALAALAARIDAIWNGIGVVAWAAGVSPKSAAAREATQDALDARLQGLPKAVCASARRVWGEARTRPYADTKMVKGWSTDVSLTVVDEHHRVQQAIVCEVAREYRKAQGLTLDRARERERKRAVQRKKDGVRTAALALADAYAKRGEVDVELLMSLADRQSERPMPRDPKHGAWELRARDTAAHVRCPGAGCGAVFSRTRNRCPECGQRRVPDLTGASLWSTTRQPRWIPLRADGFTLEWEEGAFVIRLGALGGMTVRLDEPERVAGLAVRSAKLTESRGHWYLAAAYEEPVRRVEAFADPIGVNIGLREMVTTSRGERFVMPRYFAADLDKIRKLQGARGGKARKAARSAVGRNRTQIDRLFRRQSAKRAQRHARIVRAILGMPPRRNTEAPLGRAPQGAGAPIEPPRVVYVGNWRPAHEGAARWLTVPGRDQGAASFVQVLRQNAERLGVRVVGVDEEYTTMTCSACGTGRETQVPQKMGTWTCGHCGVVHERYVNAARNILLRGIERDEGEEYAMALRSRLLPLAR